MTRLVFPKVDRPALSVIVVTYGGWSLVKQALESLIEHTEPCYEVIVVDNASPDETPERLREDVDGATVVFNPRNVGFAAGVDRGVCHATAPHVGLLNSDAMVRPGWLPPLLEVLQTDPRAGAVVPMLVNLDGTLQEAGSLLGGDGITVAWGSGDDPARPMYRFRRYIDYASAACLVMKRSTFLSVGGLDPRYPIGYYEDVDMCLALAERGLRVVYEPRSKVMHVRWGSSNVQEAGRRMHANRPILLRRWRHTLSARPPLVEWQLPKLRHRIVAARDAEALHRILVISRRVPDPASRTGTLVTALADLWPTARITLLATTGPCSADAVGGLLEHGIEVACGGPEDWEAWLEDRLFHYSVVVMADSGIFQRFEPLLRRHQPQALRVYDLGETGRKDEPAVTGALEIEALRSADVVFCRSEIQRAFVGNIGPGLTALVLPDRAEAPAEPTPGVAEEPGPGSADYGRALVEAMARVGMAPPDPGGPTPRPSATGDSPQGHRRL